MLRLVCGHRNNSRRLARIFRGKLPFVYAVYSRRNNSNELTINKVNHFSLIDMAKKEVDECYGFNRSCEITSDKTLIGGKTYEDLVIEHAANKRKSDHRYWLKKLSSDIGGFHDTLVSDWRYLHEYSYLKSKYRVVTIRLFDEKLKDTDEVQDVQTDFLLVPIQNYNQQYEKAVSAYPHYEEYDLTTRLTYTMPCKTTPKFCDVV